MIQIYNVGNKEKNTCCGCTACLDLCPKKAIRMEVDDQGFKYPTVNQSLCNNCGLCIKVCDNSINYKYDVLSSYAAKNVDEDIVLTSSSGGVVDAFCKKVILNGGAVYGVCYDESFKLVYKRASCYEECKKFRKSKYVQVDVEGIFQQIYNDLYTGIPVLFIGTACYISGLKSYLHFKKCNTDKLFLIDFICHGVPSPRVFKDYVDFVNQHKDLNDIIFRNKQKENGKKLNHPWKYGNYSCSLVFKNGRREVDTLKSRVFLNLFTSDICLRPQCYNCKYIGIQKSSDITVADYWGIDKEHPKFHDSNGVSAVMIHTLKGEELFNSLENINKIETTVEKISNKQGMLRSSSKKNEKYDEFWEDYKNYNFKFIAHKYGQLSFSGMLRNSKIYKLWSKFRYGE